MKRNVKNYFSKIGRKGGLSKSNAKAKAARLNGQKGGHQKYFKKYLVMPKPLGYTPRVVREKEALK